MRARTLACLLLIATSLAGLPTAIPAEERRSVGVLAPDGPAAAHAQWDEVAQAIGRQLPGASIEFRFFDLAGLSAAARSGNVDFVITNPGHYVELELGAGAHRIATLEPANAASPGAATASAILVRQERADLRTLPDLAGKRVLAVDALAFGGFQVAWRELRAQDIEPQRDFARLDFAGFPLSAIAEAVARGEADAGIVRACLLEEMEARGDVPRGALRVLAPRSDAQLPCARSTRAYPAWPFAALRHTPPALSRQVATALLAMPSTAQGIRWTVPTDYQEVHALFRELQIGPYAHLADPPLSGLIARYRGWLYGLALLLAAWLAHTIRVEYLVHARTRALEAALAARAAAEAESRRQQEKLDHLARLGILGELSSMLAHELSQPLAAIGNFARGIARRLESDRTDPAPLLAASREIAEQADRAREIMDGIRSFARKRPSRRETVALAAVVDSAAGLFTAVGAESPPVHCELDRTLRAHVDRLQIEQVLLNLLKNALDALSGVPASQRAIAVVLSRDGDNLRLCVRDTGSGLSPANRDRLFEPFFTTKSEGMGLGLTLCQRIVEAHGGRLWAEDNGDAPGLTVCFTLPASKEESPDD